MLNVSDLQKVEIDKKRQNHSLYKELMKIPENYHNIPILWAIH